MFRIYEPAKAYSVFKKNKKFTLKKHRADRLPDALILLNPYGSNERKRKLLAE
jgi:hypothetical protein